MLSYYSQTPRPKTKRSPPPRSRRLSGVYAPDIANPPTVVGGVQRAFEPATDYLPPRPLPTYLYKKGAVQAGTFSAPYAYAASMANPTSIPPPTRRGTSWKYNLSEFQNIAPVSTAQWTPRPWISRPTRGFVPEKTEQQFLENQAEKQCNCRLKIAASYLDRMAAAQAAGDEQRFQEESEKFYRVAYSRCRMQLYSGIRQLRQQGLKLEGQKIGECGSNYNFDAMPAKEIYAFIMLYGRSAVNQPFLDVSQLPPYQSDTNYLESIRPILLQMAKYWQQNKTSTRAPQHYRCS